jgi:CRISPR system Cascade subunit CasE
VHSLFSREGVRDFIYAADGVSDGYPRYLVVSDKEPEKSSIFSTQTRPYDLEIEEGSEFRFELTANPVVARGRRGADGKKKGHLIDVIMDRLHRVPAGLRAQKRGEAVQSAGYDWLSKQGERHGFKIEEHRLDVSGYEQVEISRDGAKPIRQSRIRYSGVLTVTDTEAFRLAVVRGVGRGRAWGCGLLKLIRIN